MSKHPILCTLITLLLALGLLPPPSASIAQASDGPLQGWYAGLSASTNAFEASGSIRTLPTEAVPFRFDRTSPPDWDDRRGGFSLTLGRGWSLGRKLFVGLELETTTLDGGEQRVDLERHNLIVQAEREYSLHLALGRRLGLEHKHVAYFQLGLIQNDIGFFYIEDELQPLAPNLGDRGGVHDPTLIALGIGYARKIGNRLSWRVDYRVAAGVLDYNNEKNDGEVVDLDLTINRASIGLVWHF